LNKKIDDCKKEESRILSLVIYAQSLSLVKSYHVQSDSVQKVQDSLESEFKKEDMVYIPQYNGWNMLHSFRVKNPEGNYKLKKVYYFFDKDITKVIDKWSLDKE